MDIRTDDKARARVFDLIKDIKVAMMASHAGGEHMHARPMMPSRRAFDGDLWFITDRRSRKVDEIADERQVLLTFADWSSQTYLSVDGRAELVEDRARLDELWSEPMRTWFPHGKDDPNIILIKVTVDSAEYWDSPSSAMVHLYGYLKAVTTGERPHPGDTARVVF